MAVLNSIISFLSALDWEWIISTLVNAAAIVVGALIVTWQVGRQFKNNRKLQKEEHRDKLFLDIYRELMLLADEVTDAEVKTTNYIRNLQMYLCWAKDTDFKTIPPAFYEMRMETILKNNDQFSKAVIELICKIESLEIIHQNLFVFRTAFNAANFEVIAVTYPPMLDTLMGIIPMGLAEEDQQKMGKAYISRQTPTAAFWQEAEPLTTAYIEACHDIGSYLHDFRVEMQNILLGGLFDHRIPQRRPIDPKHKVIALDPNSYVEELKAYFQSETEWGRNNERANAEVRAKVNVAEDYRGGE